MKSARRMLVGVAACAIAAAFGSAYVNDFIQGGRVKRVYAQADAPYRMLPRDLEKLYVRNKKGQMVPFASFASGHWTSGSPKLERFNGFPSLNILGESAPGRSSSKVVKLNLFQLLLFRLNGSAKYARSGSNYS